jgi:hypothetical protein
MMMTQKRASLAMPEQQSNKATRGWLLLLLLLLVVVVGRGVINSGFCNDFLTQIPIYKQSESVVGVVYYIFEIVKLVKISFASHQRHTEQKKPFVYLPSFATDGNCCSAIVIRSPKVVNLVSGVPVCQLAWPVSAAGACVEHRYICS